MSEMTTHLQTVGVPRDPRKYTPLPQLPHVLHLRGMVPDLRLIIALAARLIAAAQLVQAGIQLLLITSLRTAHHQVLLL